MSLYELLDLLASNYEKVDGLWNFFITVHIAVLGALFLVPRRISVSERLVFFFAYAAFSYVNRNALVDTYAYQMVLLDEIATFKIEAGETGGRAVAHLATFDLPKKIFFLQYAHPVAAGIVAIIMILANRLAGPNPRGH